MGAPRLHQALSLTMAPPEQPMAPPVPTPAPVEPVLVEEEEEESICVGAGAVLPDDAVLLAPQPDPKGWQAYEGPDGSEASRFYWHVKSCCKQTTKPAFKRAILPYVPMSWEEKIKGHPPPGARLDYDTEQYPHTPHGAPSYLYQVLMD